MTSDADLDTPLHKCVREGHIEVVRLLLQHKADLSCQNIVSSLPCPYLLSTPLSVLQRAGMGCVLC